MGDPEPVQSLRAARIDDERLKQVSGVNACKLLQIGI
jgi:hypothetical protein